MSKFITKSINLKLKRLNLIINEINYKKISQTSGLLSLARQTVPGNSTATAETLRSFRVRSFDEQIQL